MFDILSQSHDNVVGIMIKGKLTQEDYKTFVPMFEEIIEEHGSLNLLCDMSEFKSFEIAAFWEDFKFGLKHIKDIKKMAIIGDQHWLDLIAKLTSPFFKSMVKSFKTSDAKAAWQWIEEKSD